MSDPFSDAARRKCGFCGKSELDCCRYPCDGAVKSEELAKIRYTKDNISYLKNEANKLAENISSDISLLLKVVCNTVETNLSSEKRVLEEIEGLLFSAVCLARRKKMSKVIMDADTVEDVNSFETEIVLQRIQEERVMQVSKGYTPEHDDAHGSLELARAAACYATGAYLRDSGKVIWPETWDKPMLREMNYKKRLIVAAALLVAEMERVERKER